MATASRRVRSDHNRLNGFTRSYVQLTKHTSCHKVKVQSYEIF